MRAKIAPNVRRIKSANIIGVQNGSGLEMDYLIIKHRLLLMEVSDVRFIDINQGWAEKADANIFLEVFNPDYMPFGNKNFMFPNQEYFLSRWIPYLHEFDGIFCKTKHAFEIFSNLQAKAFYTSFTSLLYPQATIKKTFTVAHVMGRSPTKGTIVLIDFWSKHKQLPLLDVYFHGGSHMKNLPSCENIRFIGPKRLDLSEMGRVYSSYWFFMCPSPFEGFGHYINQAMGHGGIVLTTDAPPMNEMLENGNEGFLLNSAYQGPINLGHNFEVNFDLDLLLSIFAKEESELLKISKAAIDRFESRDAFFCEKFKETWMLF